MFVIFGYCCGSGALECSVSPFRGYFVDHPPTVLLIRLIGSCQIDGEGNMVGGDRVERFREVGSGCVFCYDQWESGCLVSAIVMRLL